MNSYFLFVSKHEAAHMRHTMWQKASFQQFTINSGFTDTLDFQQLLSRRNSPLPLLQS